MMSQSPKGKSKTVRDPPPALFLGPPSNNASHVSLPGVQPVPANPTTLSLNPSRAPLLRQRSQLATVTRASPDDSGTSVAGGGVLPAARPRQQQQQLSEGKKQADRTDALWAEMQSTLEEVELSAVNGTHVFGPDHSRALEDLRAKQIELAKAWARSEADEVVEGAEKDSKAVSGGKSLALGSEGRSLLDTAGSEGISGSGKVGSSGLGVEGFERDILEEETEHDILLARKRREANDRYFQRVNGGVLDVVRMLEEVAGAMRAVEQESRDIWGENTESTRGSVYEG